MIEATEILSPAKQPVKRPWRIKDLTGKRFGMMAVLRLSDNRANRKTRWIIQCDCGTVKELLGGNIRHSRRGSCGCVRATHRETDTPTYRSWAAMKTRCREDFVPDEKIISGNYFSRGISVCDRWLSYENFKEDMGERPPGTTIDRINNNGNYEPGNCRWATPLQQANNTSLTAHITFGGRTLGISEWAREIGINWTTIQQRLHRGWSVEKTLTTPLQKRYSHPRA